MRVGVFRVVKIQILVFWVVKFFKVPTRLKTSESIITKKLKTKKLFKIINAIN